MEISKAAKKGSMSAIDNIDMLKNKKYLSDKLNRNQEIMVQSQKQIQNQDIYILLDEYISADIEERKDEEMAIQTLPKTGRSKDYTMFAWLFSGLILLAMVILKRKVK